MSLTLLARKNGVDSAPPQPRNSPVNLRIGQPHDAFEQEADRVADRIMRGGRMPAWSLSKIGTTPMQRKCDCGASDCEECKEKKVQRKACDSAEPHAAPPIVHDVLRSPGQPLDANAKAFFESRFDRDFSDVRIHKGSRESQSARAVNALAYTVGDHIVFGPGAAEPTTPAGQRLLAHELAHTIQQSHGHSANGLPHLQRATADPSAIPPGLTCDTDPSPGTPAAVSLTGVKISGLTPQQKKQIADFHKTWAAAATQDFIAVEGYASPEGANDTKAQQQTNWTYSCKRAEIVQAEFVRLGVQRSRIITFAHGETDQFSKGDPDLNRRVNLSTVKVTAAAGTGQGTGQASGPGQAPSGFGVNGQVQGNQSNVQVKPKGQTDNPATKQAESTDKPAADKPDAGKPTAESGGPKERVLSITFEFDLKNDWKLKPPTPPPGTPSAPFLCDHGVYQLGVKWNNGIKIKDDVLEILNEPELDLNVGDPLCGERASITAQVNIIKFTILKDLFEADLVGVAGLPDGWATGLSHFPFAGSGQIKLQSTPFARISPDFKNLKIGAFGGIGFERGVETPGGEEPRTHVWTLGGFVGFDYDIGPAQKK